MSQEINTVRLIFTVSRASAVLVRRLGEGGREQQALGQLYGISFRLPALYSRELSGSWVFLGTLKWSSRAVLLLLTIPCFNPCKTDTELMPIIIILGQLLSCPARVGSAVYGLVASSAVRNTFPVFCCLAFHFYAVSCFNFAVDSVRRDRLNHIDRPTWPADRPIARRVQRR